MAKNMKDMPMMEPGGKVAVKKTVKPAAKAPKGKTTKKAVAKKKC